MVHPAYDLSAREAAPGRGKGVDTTKSGVCPSEHWPPHSGKEVCTQVANLPCSLRLRSAGRRWDCAPESLEAAT